MCQLVSCLNTSNVVGNVEEERRNLAGHLDGRCPFIDGAGRRSKDYDGHQDDHFHRHQRRH